MAKDHKKKLKRERMKADRKKHQLKTNSDTLANNFSKEEYEKGKFGLYLVLGIALLAIGFIFYSLS